MNYQYQEIVRMDDILSDSERLNEVYQHRYYLYAGYLINMQT